MSVGELVSMYRDGELDLHPEFQRFFRWTPGQKSNFIESLLLGIPVPPIFVSEDTESRWDVIDGLQRLSTILELMGDLKDDNGERKTSLKLSKTRYLPSLESKEWDSSDEANQLPESAQIKIKRARLDVNIIKQTSDEIAKYEMFQRLNTGGSFATDQEVRSCILVMTNRDFFFWVKELGEYPPFLDCLLLTERAQQEAFDLELITRFVIFTTCDPRNLSSIDELGTFLTHEITKKASDENFDKDKFKNIFEKTFDYLAKHFGENSFRKYNQSNKSYQGAFLVSLFEVIAVAIGRSLLEGKELPNDNIFIEEHQKLSDNENLKSFTKSGIRSSTRIPKTIEFGQEILNRCV
ncbi:MAG: DUF262 domain-containing protein [Coleofasciculaceae cyanobacterium RL_1_1]|nr:DUF262 domain-containing protein [Coleofasciculaceae cyanobacterium RL_1_1]